MSYFVITLSYVFLGFMYLIGFVIISTWIPPLYQAKFMKPFRYVTDAFMQPFRGILVFGPLDFTPIIGIILLQLIYRLFIFLIY
ncbi:MAG: YggT family protein [Bacilli bacterium]